MICGQKSGHGQGESGFGHMVECGESPIVYLLHAAGVIERHDLDRLGILKVGDMWIIEGHVAVLADAGTDDVDGLLCEKRTVSLTFRLRVGGVPINVLDVTWANEIKEPLSQKVAKPLWGIVWQANVLIHVEGIDSFPVQVGRRCKRSKKFILRRRCGKDRANALLRGEEMLHTRSHIIR
jgi:hypothetical protein